MNKVDFDPKNERHTLIRICIGLEEPDDIIKDLESGFEVI
ncbi:MAG: hypothetical protein EOO47_28845 [Flavobacterium sp.]|nr:MAG: hypothetical protein EOO47_28845 [Flavobacterium sp.]